MSDAENNPNESLKNELLLTAYLDGELSLDERAQAETMIRDNPDAASLVDAWQANAKQIRDLPRYQLDDQFASRVMSVVYPGSSIPSDSLNTSVADEAGFEQVSIQTKAATDPNWRTGLVAILGLAAMLLLTLFVFPLVAGKDAGSDVAVAQNGSPANAEGPTESVVDSNVVRAEPRRPGLKMSTGERGDNGRPVDPIEFTNFMSRPVGAEQVIWIDQQSLDSIKTVLQKNSIRIVIEGEANPIQDLVAQSESGVEAIFVVATSEQMKQAINELKSQSDDAIDAFPLPMGSSVLEKAKDQPAAQQIKPIDLTDEDADEIAKLDRWFGLVDQDETRLIKFLFLINTPAN